jgi:hypothetical protein
MYPVGLLANNRGIQMELRSTLAAYNHRGARNEKNASSRTLVGEVFDDAAIGQGLLNYFLRAINCGAITVDEAQSLTSLTPPELCSASFVKILDGRKK